IGYDGYIGVSVLHCVSPCISACPAPRLLCVTHLCQGRLRLGQPEGHVHGTVQHKGRGELGTGRCSLLYLGIQCAQAEVAMGSECAHAEFLGQGEGLLVVGFGLRDIGGAAWAWTTPSWCSACASRPRSFCCRARSSA